MPLGFILDSPAASELLAWALLCPPPREWPWAMGSPAVEGTGGGVEGWREGGEKEGGREGNTDFRFQGKR